MKIRIEFKKKGVKKSVIVEQSLNGAIEKIFDAVAAKVKSIGDKIDEVKSIKIVRD